MQDVTLSGSWRRPCSAHQPRPSRPSMPAVSEEVDGSKVLVLPSSLPHPGPIAHLSLKRKTMLGVAENGNSLRRSCEFGSDLLWPPPLESDGQYTPPKCKHTPSHKHTHTPPSSDHLDRFDVFVCGSFWSLGAGRTPRCVCVWSCVL